MANLAYIQISRVCNQECRFCSNPANGLIRTFKETKRLIDGLVNLGYDGIIFTGGEPTLCDDLGLILEYCKKNRINSRIITNGQKLSDYYYLEYLCDSGLKHINLSIFSLKSQVQSFLSSNINSLDNIIKALDNLSKIKIINVDINTVINKYNANHLSYNVKYLVRNYPFINHFIWNNLDPLMNKASINKDTIPRLNDFELELYLSMQYLKNNGRTLRVERVPLCYMIDFAEFSTETRKIVKNEERLVYFLDGKGKVRQNKRSAWFYEKTECCQHCLMDSICAGLYQMDKYYSSKELFPIFLDKDKIIEKIKCDP